MSNQFKPPQFNKNDDPVYWLSRFEKAAKLNKWTDEAKLYTADSCFMSKSTQTWFMDKEFDSWIHFKEEFTTKYKKKVDIDQIVKAIIDFEVKREESVKSYIERYKKITNVYKRNITKVNKNLNKSNNNEDKQLNDNTINEDFALQLTEKHLIKYFTNGIKDKMIKRMIKREAPTNLVDVYELLLDTCDSDDEEDKINYDHKTFFSFYNNN
jgi:hypothetical protein